MVAKELLNAGLVLSFTMSAAALAAAPDPENEGKEQTRPAKAEAQAATSIDLPAASRKLPDTSIRKVPKGLSEAAADRIGTAAEAAQARGLGDVGELGRIDQGIERQGGLDDLDGPLTDRNRDRRIGGRRPAGNGVPDYARGDPSGLPAGADNPADRLGNRNRNGGRYTGGGLLPPGPRASAGDGLVSQGGGNVSRRVDHGNGLVTYGKTVHGEDGSTTEYLVTYREDDGSFVSAHTTTVDADGHVTRRTLEREGTVVDYADGSTEVIVSETRTEGDDDQVTYRHPGRELGPEKGDPPPTDPNVTRPSDDPYAPGRDDDYCPPEIYGCQRESEEPRQSPNRVNPGDPELADDTDQAPRLMIDRDSLVTNPAPDGASAGRGGTLPVDVDDAATPGGHPGDPDIPDVPPGGG